jgi:thiol-disulfide isomerase/thioredoxin
MTTPGPAESPSDREETNAERSSQDPHGDAPAPLTNRIGRLAVLVAAVVLIALGLNAVLGDGDPASPANGAADDVGADTGLGISPAELPRGALAREQAPAIDVEMFDGSRFNLADHIADDGRPIVLNLWASWCLPCRTEMPEFDEVALARPDVAFVGIAVEDSPGPAMDFADEVGVSYPLGIDQDNEVADAFPYLGLPATYLINADGTVARQFQGQINKALLTALVEFDFGA